MAKPDTLKRVLRDCNIPADTINRINGDFDDITDKSPKKEKTKYLLHAVNVMDAELDENTRRKVMEACACTIGSSVEKKTEQFAKKTQNLPIEEKVRLLNQMKHLGNPVLQSDGTILINSGILDKGVYRCPCPQIRGAEITAPITFTYCMCCGGHYKYQYEKALRVKLDMKQISSPLESEGKKPCTFVLKIINS